MGVAELYTGVLFSHRASGRARLESAFLILRLPSTMTRIVGYIRFEIAREPREKSVHMRSLCAVACYVMLTFFVLLMKWEMWFGRYRPLRALDLGARRRSGIAKRDPSDWTHQEAGKESSIDDGTQHIETPRNRSRCPKDIPHTGQRHLQIGRSNQPLGCPGDPSFADGAYQHSRKTKARHR